MFQKQRAKKASFPEWSTFKWILLLVLHNEFFHFMVKDSCNNDKPLSCSALLIESYKWFSTSCSTKSVLSTLKFQVILFTFFFTETEIISVYFFLTIKYKKNIKTNNNNIQKLQSTL